ncbi:MAG: hypothetical protein DRN81_02030 [Thermoproteota archaeon]|nr:MAG: hypothetical protein DRN81_02030 [Candidatus Korarchaeota archaeon]
MSNLMDMLLQPEEKRTRDILSEVESSIAMGKPKKGRELLRKLVEFERALGKGVVTGGIGLMKKMAEVKDPMLQPQQFQGQPIQFQGTPMVSPTTLQIRPLDNKAQIDQIINRIEQLKEVI